MDEPIYPFLSFAFSGIAIIFCLLSNRIYPRTKLFTSYLAIESVILVGIWIYLVVFLLKDQHKSSAALLIIALLINQMMNVFWFLYYRKKILPFDQSYQMYKKHYPKTQKAIIILGFVTTFQVFRLQYSKVFNIKALSCTLMLKEKYYKKLNRYSLMQITFVYLPIIAANCYNLYWTWYGRQVYWVDIECIITTVLILAAHVVILLKTEHEFNYDK